MMELTAIWQVLIVSMASMACFVAYEIVTWAIKHTEHVVIRSLIVCGIILIATLLVMDSLHEYHMGNWVLESNNKSYPLSTPTLIEKPNKVYHIRELNQDFTNCEIKTSESDTLIVCEYLKIVPPDNISAYSTTSLASYVLYMPTGSTTNRGQ